MSENVIKYDKKRVMFVCHGNICRSPMAEFIFKDILRQHGRESDFFVSSSATSNEEIWNGVGNPGYPPARAELEKHELRCDGKRAVRLTKEDYGKYDLFICMDSNNVRNALRIFGSDPQGKVSKLMEHTPRGGDVADPWYTDRFDVTYRDILEGCKGLYEELK